jgi:hypothetical protein
MATEDEMLRDSMMAGSGIVPAEEPDPKPEPEPKPKPSYRIRSIDPKMGDIDEQFALIETDKAYGAPASDPTMRRIGVGDELPEGSVTAITPEGIKVIPDYEGSEEYVIPLGREGYEPPEPKKEPEYFSVLQQQQQEWLLSRIARGIEEGQQEPFSPSDTAGIVNRFFERTELRQQRIDQAREEQSKFLDPEDAIEGTFDPDEVSGLVGFEFDQSFENDKTLEMTQTPEGMQFLFQDDDGNLSSYIKIDETGEAIRMDPESGAVDTYETPQNPREQFAMTPFEELVNLIEIRAAADSL